ncbi:MAG: response regulator [Rhodospirillaceae bacterium]|nr:response regulator [Rhodospirillaceae bacterium]
MTASTMTILCAEDEPELRRDIVQELRDAGYEVIEASNGEDALMAITTLRPDIVLCDINMPRMTGLGVLEQVRASDEEHADVPFIFLTAYGEKSDLIKGRSLGADDYLVKPIDFDLLLTTVRARLESVSRSRRRLNSHAQQLERQLADFLTNGISAAVLPSGQNLHELLVDPNLPDCLLVLASIDAYHRLTPQFGSLVAQRVLENYLETFGASSGGLPSRLFQLESDVFALLVEGSHDWDKISQRVGSLVDTTLEVTGIRLPITSSIAIAEYHVGDARSSSNMLDDALLALRFARRDGGRNVVRVDDPICDRLRIMEYIENNIGRAIDEHQLFLAFQPKVRMKDRKLVGAEALIRWQSPERGLIAPGLFIPIVERTGFVDRVSDWVSTMPPRAATLFPRRGWPPKSPSMPRAPNCTATSSIASRRR